MRPFHYISVVFFLTLSLMAWQGYENRMSLWWLAPLVVLYSLFLVLGAIYIQWNFYLFSVNQGPRSQCISLTFDDGPAGQTAAILDILRKEEVPAAFFSIGKNAAAHPDLVKRWAEEGHIIGNHSFNHGFNFDWKSARSMVEEIAETNKTILSLTGRKPAFFRPPYGVTNPNLAKAIRHAGMISIGWNLRSFDTTAKNPKQLLARILTRLKGGDIILLHDSMPITLEILTELIKEARKKGFTFVRLDKLLDLKPYA